MSYFYQLFQNFVTWLLNPGRLIDAAGSILMGLTTLFGWLIPTSLQPYLASAIAYVNSGPFSKIIGLVAYFMSPMVHATVFLACLDVSLLCWLVCSLISIGFMVKGWITGTGA